MEFCPYCTKQVQPHDANSGFNEDDGWYHKLCLYQAQQDQDEDDRLNDPRHGQADDINKKYER